MPKYSNKCQKEKDFDFEYMSLNIRFIAKYLIKLLNINHKYYTLHSRWEKFLAPHSILIIG